MDRDTAVNLIALKLGDRTDLNSVIIAEMQLSQEFRLEQNGRFQPWFMITEYASIDTEVGEARVYLPSNFVSEVEESAMYYINPLSNLPVEIQKVGEDSIDSTLAPGAPKKYALLGDHFTLSPTPDAIYTLKMRYAAKQTPLTSNIENSWLKYAADLLIADVGEYVAKQNLQDKKLADSFAEMKGVAWDRLYTLHEAREHTNRSYSKGDL